MRAIAVKHVNRANKKSDKGDLRGAEKLLRKAIDADPDWAVAWFNLGLLYKHQGKWKQSLRCNQRSAKLDPWDEASWWNLGIAATALGEWEEARRAWNAYGVEVPPGEGPIDMQIGLTPIRINPEKHPEVVWSMRIDPARAIIQNVPMPESNRRYGDLLLHDGEPKGYRKHGGNEIPVFNELALLTSSDYATYEVIIEANYEADRKALENLAEERELGIEDWSTVRMLCKLCSEGHPHDHHEEQTPESEGPLVRYGIAARSQDELDMLLSDWRVDRSTCLVHEVICVLDADQIKR